MMLTILVAGAGKSSTSLIDYLLNNAEKHNWTIVVADGSAEAIAEKTNNHRRAVSAVIDITNADERRPLVKHADFVISLMPPHLHIHLAKDCLQFKKNLITSSYISPEMREMDEAVQDAGLMFMCEMGLDPGIDHMTANQIIHSIQRVAGEIKSFKSYCGGLVALESDDNPWHYKFSWNPKNIITAGLGGASYLHNDKELHVPYEEIFENNKKIKVDGVGALAYYPNRDSLKYLDVYDVPDIHTFLRATLRHPDFCKGWQTLIKLGLTTEEDKITDAKTYSDWLKNKTGYIDTSISIQQHIANKLNLTIDHKIIKMLDWLGVMADKALADAPTSSASVLLSLLLDKWAMTPEDKDMVVMQHEVEYTRKAHNIKLTSSMVIIGDNRAHSAMAKTVGLPMGVLAKLILKKKVNMPLGVRIPNMPEVYKPVLKELHHLGINFTEEVM